MQFIGKAAPQEEDDLHRELPEEFARKLEEWKKIKEGKLSPRLTRKDSEKTKANHKEKQLQWLEKELNKVEREKQRLEREREKFLEREARLERMRKAIYPCDGREGPEQEVLIQTSTGFFRFQGISEKFTKKLFEWEQQRGIAPEASTFALLDPKYHPEGEVDSGSLIRCKSVGSVAEQTGASLIVQSQPSSLSLNDVEALEAELEG
jgi:serine/arginine repetitive matrix protein 2